MKWLIYLLQCTIIQYLIIYICIWLVFYIKELFHLHNDSQIYGHKLVKMYVTVVISHTYCKVSSTYKVLPWVFAVMSNKLTKFSLLYTCCNAHKASYKVFTSMYLLQHYINLQSLYLYVLVVMSHTLTKTLPVCTCCNSTNSESLYLYIPFVMFLQKWYRY